MDRDPSNSPRQPALPVIARRRALDQIHDGDQLVIVHTARFGDATTLLRTWLAEASTPDVVTAHVLDPAATTTEDAYWSRLNDVLRGHLGQPPGRPAESRPSFASVLDALAELEKPCLVALDDLHLVADPVARVDELLAHAPPAGIRIVATTRSAGEWPARLSRTPGQKLILPESIRFEVDEVAALLRSSHLEFDVRSPAIIHRLTDGLPGLVHAVCTSVPLSELAAPTHLEEYGEAVIDREISRLIDGDRALRKHRLSLLLSAAAEPLTGDSARPLLEGSVDPDDVLGLLDRSGLAQASGNPANPDWRYPHTVRASLLRLAEREAADALHRYRVELIRCWLNLDRPDRALSMAADLQDWPTAVHILRENLAKLYTREYATTMSQEILAGIPEEFLADDPALIRMRTVHHKFAAPRDTPVPPFGGDADRPTRAEPGAEHERAGAEVSGVEHNDYDDFETRTTAFIRAVELRVQGDFEGSARQCDPLATRPFPDLATLSDDDRDALGFAYVHIGNSYILAGRFADALTMLRRSLRIALQPFIHRDASGKLALVNAILGHVTEARVNLEEERRHPALPPATELLVRPAGDVAAALLALDELDTDAALKVLQDLGEPADREEFWGFILYARGQLALLSGTPANGLRSLNSQLPRFASMHGNGAVVRPLLDSLLADLHLACDQVSAATDVVAGSTHPLTASARARTLLLSDDPVAALALARESIADPSTSTRDATELELVAAVAALATGDGERARQHCASASAMYRLTGLRRPFRTLPGSVMARLADLDGDIPVHPDAPRAEFGTLTFTEPSPRSGEGWPHHTEPHLRAPLTAREHAVLRGLATGASIRQIAAREFVSSNTIKTQVRAVYRKLGAHSRAAALRTAEALRLI